MEHEVTLDGRPDKLSGYLNAVILPRRSYQAQDRLPRINVTRRDAKVDERHLEQFRAASGYEHSSFLPFVYPLAVSFHYHLAVFGHGAFPWSLRRLLGLRNQIIQHRRIRSGELLDINVATTEMRLRRTGVELDVRSRVSSGGEAVWESTHVYFLRARVADAPTHPVKADLPQLIDAEFDARWTAPTGGGLAFARLSGDYNPIHYFTPWARLLGFKRAFCHTQRIVSDCLQRLPDGRDLIDSEHLQLDVAFKGPVYYGNRLTLRSARSEGGFRFNLHCEGDDRPAIAGHVR